MSDATREPHPGPPGLPLIGHARRMMRDPLGFLREAAALGDAVRIRIGPRHLIVMPHPDAARHVLVDHVDNYAKSPIYRRLAVAFGSGLLVSEGALWQARRQAQQPAFLPARIATLSDAMAARATALCDAWRARGGGEIDVAREMAATTLAIIVATMFGGEVGARALALSAAVDELNDFSHRRVASVIDPLRLPTPARRRFRAALRALDAEIAALVAARRASPADPAREPDLLDRLLAGREADGSPLGPTGLRDEALTMLLAGHETTAMALTWAFALIAHHPAAEERLRDELAATLGGRAPTAADLPRLTWTRAVIEEALRLYPPAWGFSRQARADDVVAGFRVRAGEIVLLSPWLAQRDARWWPRPDAFAPERFLARDERPRFAWFPFSGGPRACIGSHFALVEAQIILATVAQRWRLAPLAAGMPQPLGLVTLRPRGGWRARLEAR